MSDNQRLDCRWRMRREKEEEEKKETKEKKGLLFIRKGEETLLRASLCLHFPNADSSV